MRLRWARTHHRWTLTQAQWIHVMFSDEARFKTDESEGQLIVWRREECHADDLS